MVHISFGFGSLQGRACHLTLSLIPQSGCLTDGHSVLLPGLHKGSNEAAMPFTAKSRAEACAVAESPPHHQRGSTASRFARAFRSLPDTSLGRLHQADSWLSWFLHASCRCPSHMTAPTSGILAAVKTRQLVTVCLHAVCQFSRGAVKVAAC